MRRVLEGRQRLLDVANDLELLAQLVTAQRPLGALQRIVLARDETESQRQGKGGREGGVSERLEGSEGTLTVAMRDLSILSATSSK